MLKYQKYLLLIILFFIGFFKINVLADSHSVNEILEIIQRDLKTLEKAVYSNSSNINSGDESTEMDQNSEEVLTRHLLKLSEIENQFQELTNKFEEINFKLDKLSNRLSKVQADNQIRFQELESNSGTIINDTKVSSLEKQDEKEILPGSSQPQDLGSISYKDTETKLENQQLQSIETTNTVVTETFVSEEKI